jgi:hypothetical protein
VSGAGECVCVKLRSAIDFKDDTQGCGLGEDVAKLRFELGVQTAQGAFNEACGSLSSLE